MKINFELCFQINITLTVHRQYFDKTVGFSIAERISFFLFSLKTCQVVTRKCQKNFFSAITEKSNSSYLVIGFSQYVSKYHDNRSRVSVSQVYQF